jgi:hypothetical protein
MKKLTFIVSALTLSSLINMSFGQQIQHKAAKKQEVASNIALEQPVFHNFDGSFQFIVEPGVDVLDATFDENIIVTSKSIHHFFSQEFLALIEIKRLPNEHLTIVINKNIEVVLAPKNNNTLVYKTPFISKN